MKCPDKEDYDHWNGEWSYKAYREPAVLQEYLDSLNLVGAVFYGLKATRFMGNWDCISCHKLEADQMDGYPMGTEMTDLYVDIMDRPYIVLTDRCRLEILFASVAVPWVDHDLIPDNVGSCHLPTDKLLKWIFQSVENKKIKNVRVETVPEYNDVGYQFEWVGERDCYIDKIRIIFENDISLCFAQEYDYGIAWLEDSAGKKLECLAYDWWDIGGKEEYEDSPYR